MSEDNLVKHMSEEEINEQMTEDHTLFNVRVFVKHTDKKKTSGDLRFQRSIIGSIIEGAIATDLGNECPFPLVVKDIKVEY